MKHVFLTLLGFLLVANTLAATAWAEPCKHMQNAGIHNTHKASTAMVDAGIPCHKEAIAKAAPSKKHCADDCLCPHSLLNHQHIALDSKDILFNAAIHNSKVIAVNTGMLQISTYPPFHPPRLIS